MNKRKTNAKFKFQKQIRFIKDKSDAAKMFDIPLKPQKYEAKTFSYHGEILGIPVTIHYDDELRYWIRTGREEDLNKVYNEAINRVLGNGHASSRTLAEILGLSNTNHKPYVS